MDATTGYLTAYACGLTYGDLPEAVVHAVKRTVIDTLGCGIGGFGGEPVVIARRLAARVRGDAPARVLGTQEYTTQDMAAFANTALVRYLDCNDTYAGRGTGHPSDMIPAVLAVADPLKADGPAVITAIALAYEIFCRLVDEVPLAGWDQGLFAGIGAVCGIGHLMGLDRAALANAISLAVTPNLPLGVTRVGELAMWKGCATAASNRAAVFAAQLAAEGMTGPPRPFEGRDGLWQHMKLEPPDWSKAPTGREPLGITRASFKAFPAVIHTQGPLGLVLELREQVPLEEVAGVHIATYAEAIRRTAAEAEKWDPQTRETADHSIPYLVSAAYHDGRITPATFQPVRIQDPALRPFIRKITAVEDPEFTRRYPAESCTRVEVTTRSGQKVTAETSQPKGHRLNPLTDAEVEAKFRGLAGGALPQRRCDEVLRLAWVLEESADMEALFDSLVL